MFAGDADEGPAGELDYSLSAGRASPRFKIHSKTGQVFASRPLLPGTSFELKVSLEGVGGGFHEQNCEGINICRSIFE